MGVFPFEVPGTAVKRTVWPSGNMAGEETASELDSNTASGLPPESETVHNPRVGEGNDARRTPNWRPGDGRRP